MHKEKVYSWSSLFFTGLIVLIVRPGYRIGSRTIKRGLSRKLLNYMVWRELKPLHTWNNLSWFGESSNLCILTLHHVAKGDGVDGVEGTTRSGSSSISPPILAAFELVSCILCFSTAPSRQSRGIQDCVERTHVAQLCASSCPLLTSSPQGLLFLEKWRDKYIGSVWRPEGPWKSRQANLLQSVKSKWKEII
jgi:hypothetical protein